MVVKYCTKHELMCEWVETTLGKFMGEMLIETMEANIDKLPQSKRAGTESELEKIRENPVSVFAGTPGDEAAYEEYRLTENGNRENEPSYQIHKALCYSLRDKWNENRDELIAEMKRQYSENNISLVVTD